MRIIAGRLKGLAFAPAQRGTRPTTDRVKEALFSRLETLDALEGARVLDLYAGTGALGLEAVSRGAASLVAVESQHAAFSALRKTFQLANKALQASLISPTLPTSPVSPAEALQAQALHNASLHLQPQQQALQAVKRTAQAFVSQHNAAMQQHHAPHTTSDVARDTAHDASNNALNNDIDNASNTASHSAAVFSLVFIDPPYDVPTVQCEALLAEAAKQPSLLSADVLIVLERSTRSTPPVMPSGLALLDQRNYGETALYFIQRAS